MSSDAPAIEFDSSGNIISPFYEYLPTRYVCYIFVALFGISTLLHVGQALRYRAWWLLATAGLAGVGEVVGWGGRLWSSYAPLDENPFMMQIVCTIIAPTPLVGAVFISFGRMSERVGKYGRLSPRLYSRIFLTCDIIALAVQSVGGGIAASVNDAKTTKLGSDIMLAGIVFQLVSLTVFAVLAAEYVFRYVQDRSRRVRMHQQGSDITLAVNRENPNGMDKSMKLLLTGISIETLFLFIRAIYRTIELADGWNGRIIRTQLYFNVLDGAMVVVAIFAMNILHPAQLLASRDAKQAKWDMEAKNTTPASVA